MPLIECPECGKEVSEHAKACPHCGFRISNNTRKKKRFALKSVIGTLVFAAVLIMVWQIWFPDIFRKKSNEFANSPEEVVSRIEAGYNGDAKAYWSILSPDYKARFQNGYEEFIEWWPSCWIQRDKDMRGNVKLQYLSYKVIGLHPDDLKWQSMNVEENGNVYLLWSDDQHSAKKEEFELLKIDGYWYMEDGF